LRSERMHGSWAYNALHRIELRPTAASTGTEPAEEPAAPAAGSSFQKPGASANRGTQNCVDPETDAVINPTNPITVDGIKYDCRIMEDGSLQLVKTIVVKEAPAPAVSDQVNTTSIITGTGWTELTLDQLPEPQGYPGWIRLAGEQQSDGLPRDIEIGVGENQMLIMAGDYADVPGLGKIGGLLSFTDDPTAKDACYIIVAKGPIEWRTQTPQGVLPTIHWFARSAWDLHDVTSEADPLTWIGQKANDVRKAYPLTCGQSLQLYVYQGGQQVPLNTQMPSAPTGPNATPMPRPNAAPTTAPAAAPAQTGWTHNPTMPTAGGYPGWVKTTNSGPAKGAITMQVGANEIGLLVGNEASFTGGKTTGTCFVIASSTSVQANVGNGAYDVHQHDGSANVAAWAAQKASDLKANDPNCKAGVDVWLFR